MSNYQFPSSNQDFNAESFGQPLYQQPPRSGGGGRAFLFSCGGLTLIGVLICCCCAGVMYWFTRQPLAVATVWGAGAGAGGDWALAMDAVCEGSQAAQVTAEYRDSGARLESFSSTTNDYTATDMPVTGVMVVNGSTEAWAATLHVVKAEGGFFPYCVDTITETTR